MSESERPGQTTVQSFTFDFISNNDGIGPLPGDIITGISNSTVLNDVSWIDGDILKF